MLETKLFELRDSMTFIPVMATKIVRERETDPESHWLLGAAGYGPGGCVLLVPLQGGEARYDPYNWHGGARTFREAHHYIEENWDKLKDGDVVDVQFALGETAEVAPSEKIFYALG